MVTVLRSATSRLAYWADVSLPSPCFGARRHAHEYLLDGVHVGHHCIVVARGIDVTGVKGGAKVDHGGGGKE